MTPAYGEKFFRDDIQGLRALSAFIIMIYHIWITKVSGGVDVFFVVSGFLITSQLLRSFATNGRVQIVTFWSRMASRILPSAYLVLVVTALASLAFIPPPLWKFGINEFIASVIQVENWELFRQATSYLARDDPPSQFQQFWALSIQFQFYFIIPIVVFLFLVPLRRLRSFVPLAAVLALIGIVSFAWSVYFTAVSPAQAYFSLFTRLWEFMAGALAAMAYPLAGRLSLRPKLAGAAYLLAVATIVLAGVFIPVDLYFPGWIAAVPVGATVVFIIAGTLTSTDNIARRLLSSPGMTYLGGLSFTIYLWHWPLLIFAQHRLDTTRLPILPGLAVIAGALVLSYVTNRFVEMPTLHTLRAASPLRTLAVCALAGLVIAGGGYAIRQQMIGAANAALVAKIEPLENGPIVASAKDALPSLRSFVLSNYDRPQAISGCLSGPICTFGDAKADYVVALVGQSHAAQWQPVLDYAGKKYGFKVVTILTNAKTDEIIDKLKPDAVVTTSTTTKIYDGLDQAEVVSKDFVNFWTRLSEKGIPIVAIRDNPRFRVYQNACVWRDRDQTEVCALDKSKIFAKDNPADSYEATIPGFHSVDLSSLYCYDDTCPALAGGHIIYYDRNHFSNGYMRYIAPVASAMIMEQTGNLLGQKSAPTAAAPDHKPDLAAGG